MITKFNNFINEKYNPLEGDCSVNLGKKEFEFNVGKLVKYVEKNYKSSDIKLTDLYKLSAFKDIDTNKRDKNTIIRLGEGEWQKATDVSDEEWKQYQKENNDIIMEADLKYPIIVVVKKNGKIRSILDGNHRVKKAKTLKKDTIKAYKIPEEDLEKIKKEL